MPKWNDFGNIWTTLRELDVNAIRDEAERPLQIGCVGHPAALEQIDRLLHADVQRYTPPGGSPLLIVRLDQAGERAGDLAESDLLVLGIDARIALTASEIEAFDRLEQMPQPFLVVIVYGDRPSIEGATLPRALSLHQVAISDPDQITAADQLAQVLLGRLPGELHLAAVRQLSGLRATYARDLINSTSFTNATYALASGLPEQIPVVGVPFAAADIVILTKNQALMVYRLALAYGAPPDFQARIREVLPVVGGAFMWRQVARSLIGLIPVWGLVPKVAVAYGGTYSTGVAAWHWYATGEIIPSDQLKRISQQALALGRARATELLTRARQAQTDATERVSSNSLLNRVRRLLPGRKNDTQP